jgi:hypothetical protein
MSATVLTSCKQATESNNQNISVVKTDSVREPSNKLSGKWRYFRKGERTKPEEGVYIYFKKNNVVTLNGPDSEFEELEWKVNKNDHLILKGVSKGDDSRWTFRDTLFKTAFTQGGKVLELTGKRQTFILKKM